MEQIGLKVQKTEKRRQELVSRKQYVLRDALRDVTRNQEIGSQELRHVSGTVHQTNKAHFLRHVFSDHKSNDVR